MTNTMLDLPAASGDGLARNRALGERARAEVTPTSIVTFLSQGRLLIIGDEARSLAVAEGLADQLHCVVLTNPGTGPDVVDTGTIQIARFAAPEVNGSLGNFTVTVEVDGERKLLVTQLARAGDRFDLVLDLGETALLTHEVLPLGYYAPGTDATRLDEVVASLPEMCGEFEKPKFFVYDPEICAHGSSGIGGCTRCIDACPTLAIQSIGDKVEVDANLCQGGGGCVAACPSGAMRYAYPSVSDLLNYVRSLLRAYRDAGGENPCLVFYDGAAEDWVADGLRNSKAENLLPVRLEEIGSIGMDAWLTCLAYGAGSVVLAIAEETPGRVRAEIEAQESFTRPIIDALGFTADSLLLAENAATEASVFSRKFPLSPLQRFAAYAAPDEKRTLVRLAVEHLVTAAGAQKKQVKLPPGAPFGEIKVDRQACTLCMGCVDVCPVNALRDGAGLPQLNFSEASCVQCGLCEKACPEDAIRLGPRFLFDADARQATRRLNEEQPFCCISCGKPFATRSMLDAMQRKLEGHWMFESEEARKRLQMCENCRVKDMFSGEAGNA